jgi:tetratricopeptide (TPR) repeat protein
LEKWWKRVEERRLTCKIPEMTMRSTRVVPTVELNAAIEKHLEAAGVSQPADVAHRMAEQEYDSWHEVVLLSTNELKDLMDLVGLKHKSATKLARYAEDYRRYNQQQLAVERPESSRRKVQPNEDSTSLGYQQEAREQLDQVNHLGNLQTNTTDNEPDSPKTTGSLLTMENENMSVSSTNHGGIVNVNQNQILPFNVVTANELIVRATTAGQEHADFASAVDLFREAIELNPKSDAAWFGLGYSLYQRDGGNTDEQIA